MRKTIFVRLILVSCLISSSVLLARDLEVERYVNEFREGNGACLLEINNNKITAWLKNDENSIPAFGLYEHYRSQKIVVVYDSSPDLCEKVVKLNLFGNKDVVDKFTKEVLNKRSTTPLQDRIDYYNRLLRMGNQDNPDDGNIPFQKQNLKARIRDLEEQYNIRINDPSVKYFRALPSSASSPSKEEWQRFLSVSEKFLAILPHGIFTCTFRNGYSYIRSLNLLDFEAAHLYDKGKENERYPGAFADSGNIVIDIHYVKTLNDSQLLSTIAHEIFHTLDPFYEDNSFFEMFEGCNYNNCAQDRAVAFDSLFKFNPETGNVQLDATQLQKDYKLMKKWEIFTGSTFDPKTGKFLNLMSLNEYTREFGFSDYKLFPRIGFEKEHDQSLINEKYWNALIDSKKVRFQLTVDGYQMIIK